MSLRICSQSCNSLIAAHCNASQVGTPDSSRIWDAAAYATGQVGCCNGRCNAHGIGPRLDAVTAGGQRVCSAPSESRRDGCNGGNGGNGSNGGNGCNGCNGCNGSRPRPHGGRSRSRGHHLVVTQRNSFGTHSELIITHSVQLITGGRELEGRIPQDAAGASRYIRYIRYIRLVARCCRRATHTRRQTDDMGIHGMMDALI